MKQFLVIWYSAVDGIIHHTFVDAVRIFFASEEAQKKVISEDPELWKKIVHETTMMDIREVWTK